MKLRNKKTGEIVELLARPSFVKRDKENFLANEVICFDSLAKLNEEWQDYEEPKSWWYIDCNGEVFRGENADKEHTEEHKSIGNYYTSSKEAEKAVEKLKAWKRLKDNGMIKYSFHREKRGIDLDFYTLTILAPRDKDSLDLLFGGEE